MRLARFSRILLWIVSVMALTEIRAWTTTTPPSTTTKRENHSTELRSRHQLETAVTRGLCGIALTIGLVLGNPTIPTTDFVPSVASARVAVAPLADVGLREFLVKDGNQLLRLNLPTSLPTATSPSELGDTGREVQESVELVRLRLEQVGFSGKMPVWSACLKEVRKAKSLVDTPDMLNNIPELRLAKAKQLVSLVKVILQELEDAVRHEDIRSTLALQEDCSSLVYNVRTLSLNPGELPFEVPSEYDSLPRLEGRAIVECILEKCNGRPDYRLPDGSSTRTIILTLTIDGYHAPLTAGNFVDLVERKFYDGMPIQSAGELIVQTGNPEMDGGGGGGGGVEGFIDPSTRETRVIPLELFYKKDTAPTYGYTSDDDMRATESMANPFQAYGALGMAHDAEDVNTASSQFWFLKWDQALVAPSRNTLDGSQACFGYVTSKNQDLLSQVETGDKITTMKVIQGGENLIVSRNKII